MEHHRGGLLDPPRCICVQASEDLSFPISMPKSAPGWKTLTRRLQLLSAHSQITDAGWCLISPETHLSGSASWWRQARIPRLLTTPRPPSWRQGPDVSWTLFCFNTICSQGEYLHLLLKTPRYCIIAREKRKTVHCRHHFTQRV